nr:nucleoid-associated protein [Roseomonas mucosa]
MRRTTDGFEIVLGQDALPVNATTQRVVDNLHDLYSKRSSKAHGHFSGDRENYPTQGYLRAYVEGEEAGDFATLTDRLMTTLHVQARRRPNASGGHVFFAHFEHEEREFLLVAIVNDKLSAALTRDFGVRDVMHLDMDGFRFAGRIDMTAWKAGEQRYVGFLRGKGDVSEYFKEFLGCEATIPDKQSTQDLVIALKEFSESQSMEGTEKDEFLSRAKAICDRTARRREEIDFQTLANELVPDDPASLVEILADPNRQLGDGFVPNVRILGTLVKYRARTPYWSIEIDRSAITEGQIFFNEEENSLVIRDLPPELAADLRAELDRDGTP